MSLTAMLGFGALAVDVAWVRVNHLQLDVALQAGALGGAGFLDGTTAGVDLAIENAVAIAQANPVFAGVQLGAQHVLVGDWDPDARTFTPIASWDEETATSIDAVRMDVTLDDIPSILAKAAFGTKTLSTMGDATGYRPLKLPAGEVECYLPLAIPTCLFPEDPQVNPAPIEVNFGTANSDSVGWAIPGGVNANDVRDQLVEGCSNGALSYGDEVDVQNGIVSNAIKTVGEVLNGTKGTSAPWPTDELGAVPDRKDPKVAFPTSQSLVKTNSWGNTLQGAIALVDMGGEPGTCAGAEQFNGTQEVKGFTWAVLYDAQKETAKKSGFFIQLDFVTEREYGTEGNASAVGSVIAPAGDPVLVW